MACNSPTMLRTPCSSNLISKLPLDLDASSLALMDLVFLFDPHFLSVWFCGDDDLCNLLGKTTLLRILAGKHMVGGRDVVRVLDSSAFHDTKLVCDGQLAYLGESWSKTVGSAVSLFLFLLIHVYLNSLMFFNYFRVLDCFTWNFNELLLP